MIDKEKAKMSVRSFAGDSPYVDVGLVCSLIDSLPDEGQQAVVPARSRTVTQKNGETFTEYFEIELSGKEISEEEKRRIDADIADRNERHRHEFEGSARWSCGYWEITIRLTHFRCFIKRQGNQSFLSYAVWHSSLKSFEWFLMELPEKTQVITYQTVNVYE